MSARRRLSYSSLGLGLLALVLSACAGEDDASSNLPAFQGTPPGAVATPGAPPPAGAAGAPSPAVGGTPEQPPSGIPLGSGGAGSVPPSGANGSPASAGGSTGAPVPPAGAAGAAGSAAVTPGAAGAGGGAMAGTGGAAPVEPAQPEPPAPVVDPFPVPAGPGCGPSAFFCEGFEDFAVGPAQQNDAWRPEGNASIDATAVEGARALRLQPGGGQFARIALASFSAPNNSLFGRMFLRVEALPSSPNFAHWVVVEATGTGSSERVRPLGGQFIDLADRAIRTNFWGIGADGGPTGDWTHWDNGAPVEAQSATWQCIEWRMNGADSAIDVWIDEAFQPSMSVSRDDNPRGVPFVFPTFNNMTIGWGVFQGGTTPAQFDVHIDDIVLSTERAGCN
jgi:hypothetical protein